MTAMEITLTSFLLYQTLISTTAFLYRTHLEEMVTKDVSVLMAIPGMQLWYSAFVLLELAILMEPIVFYAAILPQVCKAAALHAQVHILITANFAS
jgi:hypothetical protein